MFTFNFTVVCLQWLSLGRLHFVQNVIGYQFIREFQFAHASYRSRPVPSVNVSILHELIYNSTQPYIWFHKIRNLWCGKLTSQTKTNKQTKQKIIRRFITFWTHVTLWSAFTIYIRYSCFLCIIFGLFYFHVIKQILFLTNNTNS